MRHNTLKYLLLLAFLAITHPAVAEWHSRTGDSMGTRISVTLWHPDPTKGQAAVDAVFGEMDRIDRTLSPYKPNSLLSRVNRQAAEQTVKLPEELNRLIDKSLYYSRLSDGAFDITYAAIGGEYDYRRGERPDASEIEKRLPAVDYRQLQWDEEKATLKFGHPHMKIDLGGIAKGYAVDRAIAILRQGGVEHATVSAGGDSRVLGDKRGKPWVIGLRNPRVEGKLALVLPLTDTAVSTSGDYERYFVDEETGERIHHIINPKTGRSADQVRSVTVLGQRGFDTDPLSTTVFVLGVEKGLALIESLSGFECLIIDHNNKLHYSSGLQPPEQKKPAQSAGP